MIIDRLLTSRPGLSPDDPSLWTTLAPFVDDVDRERVREAVRVRSAPSPRAWDRSGFLKPESSEDNLYLLSFDFRDALHQRFGWPLSRAGLAREEITRALLSREPSQAATDRTRKPRSASSGLLLPDPASIDEYFSRLVGFMGVKDHRAAALAMALPAWLAFLVELGFLQRAQAESIAGELRKRLEPLPRVLDSKVYDPAMQRDLAAAWRDAAGALWRNPEAVESGLSLNLS